MNHAHGFLGLASIGLAAILSAPGRAESSLDFTAPRDYSTGPSAVQPLTADLNRDGHLDLVVLGSGGGIYVHLGDGSGAFPTFRSYPVDPFPIHMEVGDFDGNGTLDVVTASSRTVTLLPGVGDGTLGTSITTQVDAQPNGFAAGDFDQDGDLDLAVGIEEREVLILRGLGDGRFTVDSTIPGSDSAFAVIAADLNGDGRLDLCTANYAGQTVSVFIGLPGARFSNAARFEVNRLPRSMAAADLDRDGIVDLVVGHDGSDSIAIIHGSTGGDYARTYFDCGARSSFVVLNDLNQDGNPDLLATQPFEARLAFFRGDGHGGFEFQDRYPCGTNPFYAACGDFNEDGLLDAATTNSSSPRLRIFIAASPGVFKNPLSLNLADRFHGTYHAVTTGDVDGDGIADVLAAAMPFHEEIFIFLSNGDGTFRWGGSIPAHSVGAMRVADLDGDGDPDLVVAQNIAPGVVSIYLGTGNGTFGPPTDYVFGENRNPSDVEVVDLNHDSIPDVVVANPGVHWIAPDNHNIAVLLGNGDGTFQDPVFYLAGLTPTAVAVGDLNEDGHLDLAVADHGSQTSPGRGNLYILLGVGDGTFQSGGAVPATGGTFDVQVADLNADGHADVALSGYSQVSGVEVFPGNGDGTFQPRRFFISGREPFVLLAADVDRDGRLDLVTANTSSNSISILLGNGNATFRPGVEFGTGFLPYNAALGDFDGDGRPDIVTGNRDSDDATVLLNRSLPSAPEVGRIQGVVQSFCGGPLAPVAGARVFLQLGGGVPLDSTLTAATGSFDFSAVPLGEYEIRVAAPSGFEAYPASLGVVTLSMGSQVLTESFSLRCVEQPVLFSVAPSRGGDSGPVTVTVSGQGLPSGAAVRLARSGQPDITGANVHVATGGGKLDATFDLRGKSRGLWDIRVESPNGRSATLGQAFTIERTTATRLYVDVSGPTIMRTGRETAFDIVCGNRGNVDALQVPLWITGLPSTATLVLEPAASPPPRDPGEPDWSQAPISFPSTDGQALCVLLPRVPPGGRTLRVRLTVPTSGGADPLTGFQLSAWIGMSWTGDAEFQSCLRNATGASACLGSLLQTLQASMSGDPAAAPVNARAITGKFAWSCESVTPFASAVARGAELLGFFKQGLGSDAVTIACAKVLPALWSRSLFVSLVGSLDPNMKFGPPGYGPHRDVALDEPLRYDIRFENQPGATAAAQDVVIEDRLDLAQVDPGSLALGIIRLGGRLIEPPPGASSFTTELDLRPDRNVIVRIFASFDTTTGALAWRFSSLDPVTRQPVGDPLGGFLPPNSSPPHGEGSVQLSMRARATGLSGIMFSNKARIVFDSNAPVETPLWINRLDADPPDSHVLPLPSIVDTTTRFLVQWSGTDGHSGIRDYTVFVSDNGGAFEPWRMNTSALEDSFQATEGHAYDFYTVARDSVGNVESTPEIPDAHIEVGGPTSTLGALLDTRVESGRVLLRWRPSFRRCCFAVERRSTTSSWVRLIDQLGDEEGVIAFADSSIVAGARYGYRVVEEPGIAWGVVWIEIPAAARFALDKVQPNPSVGDVLIHFSLPDREDARLELIDLSGRVLWSRGVGALGPGKHGLRIDRGEALPPGLYWVRLSGRRGTQVTSLVVLR